MPEPGNSHPGMEGTIQPARRWVCSEKAMNFEHLRKDSERCLGLVRDICRRHGILTPCVQLADRSQLVFASADRHVLKIFPPWSRSILS